MPNYAAIKAGADVANSCSGVVDAMIGRINYNEYYDSFLTGNRQPTDRLLHKEEIKVASGDSWVMIKTVPMNYSGFSPITHINVESVWRDGTNGYVKLEKGGVNFNYVRLSFKSKPFRGMHFRVSIYGKKK